MTDTGQSDNSTNDSLSSSSWDASIETLGGDLLQRWNWGEFKSRNGWSVERVRSSTGSVAQILYRHFGPLSLAYIPRGPLVAPDAHDDLELLHEIDAACVRRRAVSLIVEPAHPIPDAWCHAGLGFKPAEQSIQSPRTIHVDLSLDDDALLRQMRKDTHYNISYARRNGTVAEHVEPTSQAMDTFFSILSETSSRGEFGIHGRDYYADFMTIFGDEATLIFSRTDGEITAALIACRHGNAARSMYAGMRPSRRARGDAALLRFAAMQWARDQGCAIYDLGGLAPVAPETVDDDPTHPRAQAVASMKGVEHFKTGFGGRVVTYPPTMERLYRPYLVTLARRFQRVVPRQSD